MESQAASPPQAGVGSAPPPAQEKDELRRSLSERQLTMIAIGGAIGVGLFLGSGLTIQLAGPGVIISYLLGAAIAAVVAYCLAEMAVVHPFSGSFGIYAETYLSRWVGFCVRATYGLVQIIAIGAEVTAVAIYFAYWFPHVRPWIWVFLVSLALVAINALQVSDFGEFEYWFAAIKVLAILIFIAVGVALISGIGPRSAIGFQNLSRNGGFLPHGLKGVWLALTLAITSYMGVEIIAVTSGEAKQPSKTIPNAMRAILFRLILFYVLAISITVAMNPWNELGSGITASPFVRAFTAAGIPFAASIMNLVVITAAISSANTNLYLSTRMLYSLSRGGFAPNWLGRLSGNGVPHRALALSTSGMLVAILLAILAPHNAFLLLYGTAVAGMFFVWFVILLTHFRFRETIGRERVAQLPVKLPMHPWTTVAGLVAVLCIAGTTFWVDGLQYSIPAFAAFLLIGTLIYFRRRKKQDWTDLSLRS
jgi:AAT family amino acid transporter